MNPIYHIHFRPHGQRGSEVQAFVAYNTDGEYASGPWMRGLWDKMVLGLNKDGYMSHPETEQRLEFASLNYGGYAISRGAVSGGTVCRTWDKDKGLVFVTEPEPELYGAEAIRRKMEAANAVPDQPAPPIAEPDSISSHYGLPDTNQDPVDRTPIAEMLNDADDVATVVATKKRTKARA